MRLASTDPGLGSKTSAGWRAKPAMKSNGWRTMARAFSAYRDSPT